MNRHIFILLVPIRLYYPIWYSAWLELFRYLAPAPGLSSITWINVPHWSSEWFDVHQFFLPQAHHLGFWLQFSDIIYSQTDSSTFSLLLPHIPPDPIGGRGGSGLQHFKIQNIFSDYLVGDLSRQLGNEIQNLQEREKLSAKVQILKG